MWSGTAASPRSLSPDSHREPSAPSTEVMGLGITLFQDELAKPAFGILQGARLSHLDGSPGSEREDQNPFGCHYAPLPAPACLIPSLTPQTHSTVGCPPPESCSFPSAFGAAHSANRTFPWGGGGGR